MSFALLFDGFAESWLPCRRAFRLCAMIFTTRTQHDPMNPASCHARPETKHVNVLCLCGMALAVHAQSSCSRWLAIDTDAGVSIQVFPKDVFFFVARSLPKVLMTQLRSAWLCSWRRGQILSCLAGFGFHRGKC